MTTTQPGSRPVRYQLITKEGICWAGMEFNTAREAIYKASALWPDQSQDPERTGKGWDVQVVGAGS